MSFGFLVSGVECTIEWASKVGVPSAEGELGFGFRDSRFGSGVSGSGVRARVSGSEFRVLGFGFGVNH